MNTLRVILGDQLSDTISSLRDIDSSQDIILMCELEEECTYVKHHQKKIVFILSAMRHFAEALRNKGYHVAYISLDDSSNTNCFLGEIKRAVALYNPTKVVVTFPGEYRVLQIFNQLKKEITIPVEVREDDRFLISPKDFSAWATQKKELRMEFFYRYMRQTHNILMFQGKPEGGKWNYDADNRKFPKQKLLIPKSYSCPPDNITKEVIDLVKSKFSTHFGDIEPFFYAVTREQALDALHLFIEQRLKYFGDYQDAMIQNEPWMYHSHISFYINIGLLSPRECIQDAEQAYRNGKVSLNAAEGFIRQILGWREYVRGIYWLEMPQYKASNFLNATRALPALYWTADTNMNCLKQCVNETRKNAYAHHIQRLMVLGNFALLMGVHPDELNEWYLIVYADAFEWVELPNVSGMILFADGGYLASKPYAASGAYINKMSNYCKNCHYDVAQKEGDKACPFNYLYWNFLIENRDKLKNNHRLKMIYSTLDKMLAEKTTRIQSNAQAFIQNLAKEEYEN